MILNSKKHYITNEKHVGLYEARTLLIKYLKQVSFSYELRIHTKPVHWTTAIVCKI